MADKRISQLVERINIANNDVLPIVASGATTTNKVTVSTLQDWMQDNLDVGVTSVGLSMPSAFTVSGSPVTTSGNISVVGAGTVSQYIRGDGSLADFPQGGGGGGASVNYYLNGSVSQGTIGGIAYTELSKVPILGTGTDFTINADGYIASFITDAGDPSLLQIPGGNWNFETYFQASSGGGSPTFYVELYKVSAAGTATLIASNSGSPELIAFGTNITPYFSSLAVPTTTLALTDRLAIRYYVVHSGRTITLHTENNTLCQIITTFTTGLTALNGLTAQVQNFATGTSGTDFNISSASTTHTFNIPTASGTNRGALSSADWTTFNGKQNALNGTGFVKISGTTISYDNSTYLTTSSAGSTYVPYTGAAASVNLGVYNITANAINSAGSASNAGQINLRSDAFFSLVNGYGSIASGTTNQFNFYQTTGAGVFRGAIFSLNSITPSATRTFTLPDASGTLAFTSDISTAVAGYLPLTGGTLSNNLFITGGGLQVSGSSSANRQVAELYTSGSVSRLAASYVGSSSYGSLELLTGGLARLSIASTGGVTLTGALNGTSASFSSTTEASNASTASVVLAGGLGVAKNIRSAQNIIAEGAGGTIATLNGGDIQVYTSGNANFSSISSPSNGNMVLKVNIGATPINALTLASTGAATFSSSVTASGAIKLLTAANGTNAINFGTSAVNYHTITYDDSTGKLTFNTDSSRIVSFLNSNVGIGTASPQSWTRLEVAGTPGAQTDAAQQVTIAAPTTTVGHGAGLRFNAASGAKEAVGIVGMVNEASGNLGAMTFHTYGGGANIPERMRITSGGDICINTNSSINGSIFTIVKASGTIATTSGGTTAAQNHFVFANPNGNVGSIQVSGSATSYNTSSDYRLKENVKPVENALYILNQLKPCSFNFIADADEEVMGFIAHEVQEVIPQAVTGEKDEFRIEEVEVSPAELDEDGNVITEAVVEEKEIPVYQGIDHSKLVPLLVAAIQELKTEIDSLKNQIK